MPQEKKEKKPIGRTPKFNKVSKVISVRVPEESEEIYKAKVNESVIQLATDRGELK